METDPLPYLTASGWDAPLHPTLPAAIAGILLLMFLLFLSALISGSEVAYFSLDPHDQQKKGSEKKPCPPSVLRNLEDPERLLATILVANNLVNIAIVVIAVYAFSLFVRLSDAGAFGSLFLIIAIVFPLLFFVTALSRAYAARDAIRVARIMAVPLRVMMRVFNVLNTFLIKSSQGIRKRVQNHTRHISLDDLSEALELTSKEDYYEDKEILEGIVRFGSKNVAEIMRVPGEVVALDWKDPFGKVLQVVNESGYSRIPVYSGSFGNIRGVLYTKDLLPFIHGQAAFQWQSIVRPPFLVPETKKIDDLLEEFRKNKVHMAVVIKETGESAGIVTLEDVLEEIVGDMLDEFDEDDLHPPVPLN
ncbi:MAG: CNNM domain-containing protein [Mangrovibacterium sp.]|nr:CNNM domain-containing protein [Mangrovibacterium sp.]